MGINVWSYLAEYEAEREDLLGVVDKVFRSGQLVLGTSVRSFEAAFAAMHGRSHRVGVDNGTNALAWARRRARGRGDHGVEHRRARRLPDYRHLGVAFDENALRYNPTGELIFPCIRGARGRVPNPLAKYYLYYAPHDAPGGICLSYGERLDRPFWPGCGNARAGWPRWPGRC